MSVHAASWAWRQKIGDAGAKLVLVKLADQANDRGECWPSQRRLADDCEMSRRTVQRKIDILRAAGLVSAEPRRRADGGDSSLMYRVGPVRQSDAPPSDTGDVPPAPPVSHHELSSEPSSPSEDGEGDAQRAARARDDIWDDLEERFGSVGSDRRAQAHQKRNKAVADLRRLGATPHSIRHAVDAWSRQFVGATLTDIALATLFPQLTAGYSPPAPPEHPVELEQAQPSSVAQLHRDAGDLRLRLKRSTCPECSIGGGHHTADCARETPRLAYRRFVEAAAAEPDYPLGEVEAVMATWTGLDDVERQELLELAERVRAEHTTEEAA